MRRMAIAVATCAAAAGSTGVRADLLGLEAEVHAVPLIEGTPWVVWRVYAVVDNRADTVEAISGNAANPILITTDVGTFYQHPAGGDIEHETKAEGTFPDLVHDTYVTINSTDAAIGPDTQVFGKLQFEPARLSTTDGAWYRTPGEPLTVAGPSRRVLIGQLTVDGNARLEGTMRVAGRFDGVPQQFLDQTFLAIFGDATDDGAVDGDDVMTVVANWGACGGGPGDPCNGDVNGDEKVDVDDLVVVILHWQP